MRPDPMFFLMRCLHHEGQDAARDTHRPSHRAWVQSGGEGLAAVLIGSALVDEGGSSIGNFGIIEATSLVEAQAFAEGDPFNRAGIVAAIELTQLPDTFQAARISDPMTPRKNS
ncbi:YciI family protein [Neorhizobium galegae]|uniref:YciI family protein n=1 Tax=Neorhizobium galegae TaxID=399 RepID=UPI002034B9B5|nr:YciI family protein [Neorhizobium galegae]MCM2497912.1 YciI family protein [Neorhizobium galegae]MCQ1775413.1 YciI family protein [Neorhizobium galegae]MCQ1777080.1 YciI family protein [Neorhizobium galegae]